MLILANNGSIAICSDQPELYGCIRRPWLALDPGSRRRGSCDGGGTQGKDQAVSGKKPRISLAARKELHMGKRLSPIYFEGQRQLAVVRIQFGTLERADSLLRMFYGLLRGRHGSQQH